jgi:succinate dehydrogenase/fumarate reductase cytochrome b subunit
LLRLGRAAYHSVGKIILDKIILKEGKTMRYGGLGGLIVLIADVWAIVNIFQSGASTADKVLWTVIVIVLPILGFILWFFLGPRTGRA